MKPHHKPLVGALAMLGALGVGIVGWAEMPRAIDRKSEAPSNLFPCPNPYHHDGDAIRCGHEGRSDRLYAIDAPEMPGAAHQSVHQRLTAPFETDTQTMSTG